MILGILSDTHGRFETARLAVDRLRELGADYLIHCGDIGDAVLPLLPEGRSAFVIGNTDWDADALASEAALYDVRALGAGGTLDLDGTRVAVTHGDDPKQVARLLADTDVRYLFTGHTHALHDRRQNGVRWINPGALHRASRKTVATLDLASDDLRIHEIRV